jgi:PAS domain S-box-containing protein
MKDRHGVGSAAGGSVDARLPPQGALQAKPQIADLISHLANDFASLSPEANDEHITDTLRELAHYAQAVGGLLVALSPDLGAASITHRWSADPEDSPTALFSSFPLEGLSWCAEALGRGESVAVRTPADVPLDAQSARELMEARGFRPLLFVPMKAGGALNGCLIFYGAEGDKQDWPEDRLPLLQFTADLIAERKRAEEASHESERQYRALFENAAVGIGVSDERGRLLAFNDAMLRPGGHSRADIARIGHIAALYYDPEDRDEVRDLLEKQGSVEGYRVRFRRKDGTPYWASLSLSQVTFQGRPCTQALVEDITERERAEELLRLRARQQTAVATLGLSALTGTDLSSLVDELVTLVAQTLEVEYCGVLELLPDARALVLRAGFGWKDGLVGTATVDAGLDSQAGFTLQCATPVVVEDLRTETRFSSPPLMHDHGVVSGASVVIAGRDRPYGVLGAQSVRHHRLTEDDTQFLQAAANVLAAAIERTRVEGQLRESEARFAAFMQHLPATAFIKDSRSHIVYVNHHVEREDAERAWIGRSPSDIFPEPLAEKMVADDQEALESGYSESVDMVPDAHGDLRTVETRKFRIDRENQEPLLGGFAIDITERTRMERFLRFTQYSVDHAADNIFWLDAGGNITYASEATCERLGYTLEEMLHLTIYDIDTAAPSPWHEHWEKVRDEGRRTFEVIHRAKDGTCVPVEVSTNLVVYEGKEYHFSYARDITERKRAEEERERLQSQLLQAQKMESVGRLAGGVAHDFNNMLEVILGHAELAMDQLGQSHPVSSDLWEIRRAAERSANITRQLLAFARRQIVVPKVIDLNETVTGTIKMLERLISESIELLWRPGDNLGSVEMDPAQIDQILVNLCINARDALGSTGRITIETAAASIDEAYSAMHEGSVPGEYVVLTVSDNGCGMDQDLLAHMFEPFFTTKETGKGTGLGLATIYGIVKQNCGFLDVQSEPSRGTRVSAYLPRHGGVLSLAEDRPAASPTLPIGNGEIVLVVEDEIPILLLIERALTRVNYRVLTASTPSEALRSAESCPDKIALLITDVVMPEMDGWDLARQLSSLRPDLKTLFMSGYAADIVSGRKMLDREVRFMQKPFSPRDLATAVRAALDQK